MDVDTFLTELYVMVDDFCKTWSGMRPRPGPSSALTMSEMVTLLVFSQWGKFDGERSFYRYAHRHLRQAFPTLPTRPQFNRQARRIIPTLCAFNRHLARRLGSRHCAYEAMDTMGCRTRNAQRRGSGWLPGVANIGRCNRLGWYEGFNVITSVTPTGVITGFGMAPASTKEQPFAETFLAARAVQESRLPEVGLPAVGWYVADNGFCGLKRHRRWRDAYGAYLISPPKRTVSRRPWPRWLRRWLASIRQIVETVHEKLLNTFGLDRERPKRVQGFRARLAATVCLHNFCIWLNRQRARAHLAFAELIDW